MTDFVLKTESERSLYVEALFHCLEHGTLTVADAAKDLQDLIANTDQFTSDPLGQRTLLNRISGVLQAYKTGVITKPIAIANCADLFAKTAA